MAKRIKGRSGSPARAKSAAPRSRKKSTKRGSKAWKDAVAEGVRKSWEKKAKNPTKRKAKPVVAHPWGSLVTAALASLNTGRR